MPFWLVLAAGTALLVVVWFGLRGEAARNADEVFQIRTQEIVGLIEKRMHDHAQILLGGAGLFDASASVERDEWKAYYNRLALARNYPGIQGVGYAQIVKPADLAAHIAAIRAQGFPDFTVHPDGKRDLYSSIIYLEPFAERNLAAFGYDMMSEPTRAAAMHRAAETGRTTISGKVTLVQETHGPTQAGFLMYLPIYERSCNPKTAQERWDCLQGFVYSPYRMNDLMGGILREQERDIGFVIYDGRIADDRTKMYESGEPGAVSSGFSANRTIENFGRVWTVQLFSLPRFLVNIEPKYETEALILGSILVVLLAALVFSITVGRERAEDLAEEMSWRTRAIVETALDGIITVDAEGALETVNPAAERMFGFAARELIGQNVRILMKEPFHTGQVGFRSKYRKRPQTQLIGAVREMTGLRKDGSTFPMELAASEMSAEGRHMFTGIVRDISDRKIAEKAKSEFISTVSHELRTPLTSIQGSLGLMMSGAVGAVPDGVRKMLEIAHNNSDRLLRLINDILDVEKLEAGKMDFAMRPVDLRQLIQSAVEANKNYGEQFGVRFVLTDMPATAKILGDSDRLMQVLANLLSNAAKFSPENAEVEISLTERDSSFRIAVKDHGPGIPVEYHSKIFERFSQGDSSDSRHKGGTGLGLNISRSIVQAHGGTISFDCAGGTGTTFFVDLPA